MARRTGGRRPGPVARDPHAPPPLRLSPPRPRGLRPIGALPGRARLGLGVGELVVLGFLVWISYRVLHLYSETVAILLIALCCVGAFVVGTAIATTIRLLYSLDQLPYLLGRLIRRLLRGRRSASSSR